jgi:hypothetical protein
MRLGSPWKPSIVLVTALACGAGVASARGAGGNRGFGAPPIKCSVAQGDEGCRLMTGAVKRPVPPLQQSDCDPPL